MKKPKILFLDVETKPVKVWTFRIGSKININHEAICDGEKFDIITICYKFSGDKKVQSLDWGCKKQDSGKMLDKIAEVIESADIVVGHNLDRFDLKQIQMQRLLHGQAPIAFPSSQDTLKQFRRHFMFTSNRLDYLARTLVGTGKDRMGFQDWIDICQDKDPKALAKMIKYCKKDVEILENVYNKAVAFFTPRVNQSIIINGDKKGCPACGSTRTCSQGIQYNVSSTYQRLRCRACDHSFKGKNIKVA